MSKKIRWNFHVAKSTHSLGYDMIIGRDLLEDLGIIIDFRNRKLVWDDLSMEMTLETDRTKQLCNIITFKVPKEREPDRVKNMSRRITCILSLGTNKPTVISHMVEMCAHLGTTQKAVF